MIIITNEMLDRIESIRDAATSSIRSSSLPESLQISLRQNMNASIDATVAAALKESNSVVTTQTNTDGNFFSA
jgi:hypothetical protein